MLPRARAMTRKMIPVATSLPVAPPPPPGRFEGTLIGLPMVMEAKCTVTLPDGTPCTVPAELLKHPGGRAG
jgi:hypothetical protein